MTDHLTDEQIVARALDGVYGGFANVPNDGASADAFWSKGALAGIAALRAAGRLADPEHVCSACGATTGECMADKGEVGT